MTIYELRDCNGQINQTLYTKEAAAITAAKREATRRCFSGKFCGNSEIAVVLRADTMESVWATDNTVFTAMPNLARVAA